MKENNKPSFEINQIKSLLKLLFTDSEIFHTQVGLLIKKISSLKVTNSALQDAILNPSNGLKKLNIIF